jgi:tRNA G18 (ribose-2'-O)-methylase SpoU
MANSASLFDSGFHDDIEKQDKVPMKLEDTRPLNIAERFRGMPPAEILENIRPHMLPFAIMAVNITMCLNISNMIRTANLCGASKFILFGRRKYDARGCVGAQNYTPIEKIAAIPDASLINFEDITPEETDDLLDVQIFIDYIKANNYLPVFMEQDKFSRPATNGNITDIIRRASDLSRTPLFIFGSEGFGIPRNMLDTRINGGIDLSYTLELQQRGCIRSFNVANCCSIICYKVMEVFDELA